MLWKNCRGAFVQKRYCHLLYIHQDQIAAAPPAADNYRGG
jgi:hypothetical protein